MHKENEASQVLRWRTFLTVSVCDHSKIDVDGEALHLNAYKYTSLNSSIQI